MQIDKILDRLTMPKPVGYFDIIFNKNDNEYTLISRCYHGLVEKIKINKR